VFLVCSLPRGEFSPPAPIEDAEEYCREDEEQENSPYLLDESGEGVEDHHQYKHESTCKGYQHQLCECLRGCFGLDFVLPEPEHAVVLVVCLDQHHTHHTSDTKSVDVLGSSAG
jgi:hypothetical protein